MYRVMYKDIALGIPGLLANANGIMERLFLQYYPGGDMGGFLEELRERGPLEEEDVWWIFYCLGLACSVCDGGTEDLDKPKWKHEIAHLDLEPKNGMGSFIIVHLTDSADI